jgi:hypothetical protein
MVPDIMELQNLMQEAQKKQKSKKRIFTNPEPVELEAETRRNAPTVKN